jgi:hypothetical protein
MRDPAHPADDLRRAEFDPAHCERTQNHFQSGVCSLVPFTSPVLASGRIIANSAKVPCAPGNHTCEPPTRRDFSNLQRSRAELKMMDGHGGNLRVLQPIVSEGPGYRLVLPPCAVAFARFS